MHIEEFREYCLSKPGTSEGFPFDEKTLVFKVMNKIFAITGLENEEFKVNLKCDPDWSIELRDKYSAIIPGYHMNKQHWNTVTFEGDIEDVFLKELIDHSYDLIANSLKKADREALKNMQ